MDIMKDIPKLYTALAEGLSCLTVILLYRRFIKKKLAVVCLKLIISLVLLCVIQTLCGMVSNGLWLVGMLSAILVMIVTIKTCIGLGWDAAFYGSARAFMRAEMLAALEWQIYYYYFERNGKGNRVFSIVFCLVIFAAGFALIYYLESRQLPVNLSIAQLAVSYKQIFVVWATALFIFAISNLSYIEVKSPFTGSGFKEIFNIRTLIDLAGLLMLEAFHMQKADADRIQEMSAVQNILRTQYAQYRESQENIDMINRKYHDLKHQLQVLRDESNYEKRAVYLDEIEQGIRQYEAENKTGNSVLDTILTSKSSQCLKQGISFTVVADGTLLNHIHVMDFCTIFGNAIDNAIEYEVQVEDPEKRMIHVSVSGKNQLVCIIVENYYEGILELDGRLPKTTKHDKSNHGYGLKSIQYSVEKYDGYVNVGIKDHWFRLEMILPKAV